MSNAMSRSKSRWKGALLATVAGAVVSPMAANAGMSVGVYLSPLGSGSPITTNFVTPDSNYVDVPLYVYATITGVQTLTGTAGSMPALTGSTSAVVSTGQFDGLQYLYYNVTATGGNAGGITGGMDTSVLNAGLNFNSNGSQLGTNQLTLGSSLAASSTVLAVGAVTDGINPVSSAAMTDFAKPRASSAVWQDYASFNAVSGTYTYKNDGTNIIIGTNSVSFLVETLNYKTAINATAYTGSTSGNLVSTTFSVVAPFNAAGGSLLNTGSSYQTSNYFLDSTSSLPGMQSNATGGSLSANTRSVYTVATTGVGTATLIETLPGDATKDGIVNFNDLLVLAQNYQKTVPAASAFASGDFTGDDFVNFNDLLVLAQNYQKNLGITAAEAVELDQLGGSSFVSQWNLALADVSAVPEPTTLGLACVASVGLLLRRRKSN